MRSSLRCALFVVVLVNWIAGAFPCRAQCREWDERFWRSGTDGPVHVESLFDDGSGPALFVGGGFVTAGSAPANGIAKWNGSTWSGLGDGVSGGPGVATVHALCVFDDGNGPALYAGGQFAIAGGATANNIARWDGASWTAVSTGTSSWADTIEALDVYDDGTGPALYATGDFGNIGGVNASRIAKWDGVSWTTLGSGLTNTGYALTVFDDGSGAKLYAGGTFTNAGGVTASRIARWNGSSWSTLGSGVGSTVGALTVFDDGTGAALYAGGSFSTAGGVSANSVARWNGSSWSALGSGFTFAGGVGDLTVYDDGAGAALYVGGTFLVAGGAGTRNIARWNGSTWSTVGSGTNGSVHALGVFDAGSGAALYVGGEFSDAGGEITSNLAVWHADAWSVPDHGVGLTAPAEALCVFDDGSGSALYAGGDFLSAGNTLASRIAKWDGANWSALGSGLDNRVNVLCTFDDGSGPALIAGGNFVVAGGVSAPRIAKWDGANWSSLDTGMNSNVHALAVFDDGAGPALYVGGFFSTAGGVGANRIAKWDGTSWSALGSGMNNVVEALCVFDDGSGPALYAGGNFTSAGGVPASYLAKWNGSAWSATGEPNARVFDLAVHDDGSGPALYAGGEFGTVGGVGASCIARWDGANWSSLGSGMNSAVNALAVFDDGSGSALYAGGLFNVAGGVSSKRIAKWDGASWAPLTGGMETYVRALAVFDDGADGAPDLFAGGWFISADAMPSAYVAEWHGCPPGTAYCFGDGIDAVVTAMCPCTNFGDPGHGCANSNPALGGARLYATGTTSPNTLLFTCEGIPNNALSTFWRGTTNTAGGGVVHDGIQCLGGTTIRFGQQFAGQLGNPPNTISSGTIGLAPGSTRYYQVLYRNPAPGFCPPGTYNFSNGYKVTW